MADLLAVDSVDEPSQFTSASLAALDSTLRCPICNEFFKGCVSLHCGHSFCSECIREFLSFNPAQRCPSCNEQTDQGRIRVNPGLDEAVRSWRDARSRILALDTQPAPERPRASSSRASGSRSSRPQSPVGLLVTDEDEDVKPVLRLSQKRTALGSARPKGKGKALAAHASSDIEFVDEPPPRRSSARNTRANGSADSDTNQMSSCPLCQAKMTVAQVQRHVDNCNGTPPSKSTQTGAGASGWGFLSGPPAAKPTAAKSELLSKVDSEGRFIRLPLVSYNVMPLKKVKASLEELGLPISGPAGLRKNSQEELEFLKRRHREFTLKWNANCDVHPSDDRHKTELEVKKDLAAWETRTDKSEKKDIGDGEQYQAAHQSQFAELTRKARESARAARDQQRAKEDDNDNEEIAALADEAQAAATEPNPLSSTSSTLASILSPPTSSRPTRARTVAFADIPPPARAKSVEVVMEETDSDEEDEEGQLKFPRLSQRVREEELLWKRRAEEADDESSSGSEAALPELDEMSEDDD